VQQVHAAVQVVNPDPQPRLVGEALAVVVPCGPLGEATALQSISDWVNLSSLSTLYTSKRMGNFRRKGAKPEVQFVDSLTKGVRRQTGMVLVSQICLVIWYIAGVFSSSPSDLR